jgi:hypothetical protein
MASAAFAFGDLLLALLIFSDGRGSKKRPVLVVYDFGDADLLVVPVTSHSKSNSRRAPLRQGA